MGGDRREGVGGLKEGRSLATTLSLNALSFPPVYHASVEHVVRERGFLDT